MGTKATLPVCDGRGCSRRLYYLRERCPDCGTRNDWNAFLRVDCPTCRRTVDATRRSCTCGERPNVWMAIVRNAVAHPAHTDLAVAKESVPHPRGWRFEAGSGKPVGQRANYRFPLPDGRGIHVKEFDDRYEVHWDRVAPSRNGLGHLVSDAPAETLALSGLLYLLFAGGVRRRERIPSVLGAVRSVLPLPRLRSFGSPSLRSKPYD